MKIETPVLVVGGGPVGLALALELGWRGAECLLVEELERAESFASVALRYRWRFDSFVQDAGGVTSSITDTATGESHTVHSAYLAACCGGRSPIRRILGIDQNEGEVLGAPLSIYFRARN